MGDRKKIFAESLDVLIAAADTSSGDLSLWTDVGWCENGKTRLTVSTIWVLHFSNDKDLVIAMRYVFEAVGLETDMAKLTALEAFVNQHVDVLLVNHFNHNIKYVLKDMAMVILPEYNFSIDNPRRLKLEGSQVRERRHFSSETWEQRYIIGLEDAGVI